MASMAKIPDRSDTTHLVEQAVRGDQQAWGELLARHRDRLRRMVALRLDRRLQGRVDASDVIQEAMLEASRRLAEYRQNPTMPFFLWLRVPHRPAAAGAAPPPPRGPGPRRGPGDLAVSRRHARDDHGRAGGPAPGPASPRPARPRIRAERKIRLQEALNSLDPIDREILALRHFEQLSNGEAAEVLGLDKSAASKRYARALDPAQGRSWRACPAARRV